MPYAPTVNDNSGQILAAGINGASQSFFQGLQQYAVRKQENKDLEAQNRALETLIRPAATSSGLSPEVIDSLTQSAPDESPRARNARLTATFTGIQSQQRLSQEATAQKLQQLQLDAAQHDSAAAQVATAPTLPSANDVSTAFNSGQQLPSVKPPDYGDAVLKYLNAGGKNPSTLNALNEMARTKMVTSEREKAAGMRATAAEDKLSNATGNFDSIDKAATKALQLQKQGLQGVHVVTKAKGTYDIEVKPPTAYAPDAATKVQAAIDAATEELTAAQEAGDTAGIAAAQRKLANFTARMTKINTASTGLAGLFTVPPASGSVPGAGSVPGSGSFLDNVNAVAGNPIGSATSPVAGPTPAAAPAATGGKPGVGPTPAAVQYLRAHPELAPQFDQKYGKGAAATLLGAQ